MYATGKMLCVVCNKREWREWRQVGCIPAGHILSDNDRTAFADKMGGETILVEIPFRHFDLGELEPIEACTDESVRPIMMRRSGSPKRATFKDSLRLHGQVRYRCVVALHLDGIRVSQRTEDGYRGLPVDEQPSSMGRTLRDMALNGSLSIHA